MIFALLWKFQSKLWRVKSPTITYDFDQLPIMQAVCALCCKSMLVFSQKKKQINIQSLTKTEHFIYLKLSKKGSSSSQTFFFLEFSLHIDTGSWGNFFLLYVLRTTRGSQTHTHTSIQGNVESVTSRTSLWVGVCDSSRFICYGFTFLVQSDWNQKSVCVFFFFSSFQKGHLQPLDNLVRGCSPTFQLQYGHHAHRQQKVKLFCLFPGMGTHCPT